MNDIFTLVSILFPASVIVFHFVSSINTLNRKLGDVEDRLDRLSKEALALVNADIEILKIIQEDMSNRAQNDKSKIDTKITNIE